MQAHRRAVGVAESEPEGAARPQRPDGRLEVLGRAGDIGVPEAVDEDDDGFEAAPNDPRLGLGETDEILRRDGRADGLEGYARRQMGRHGGEDVAAVEGRGDGLATEGGVREEASLDDPAEGLGGRDEEPVVGPDEDVAAPDPKTDRPALGPDAGVDDGDVDAHRQIREGEDEPPCTVGDGKLPNGVADVEDRRLGTDAEDDTPADGGRDVGPEVAQEADEGSHGRR
ncbi:MAG: hypothetical protein KatS3mg065_0962 [Chloroflexota bacterium]|nr:MAG: hypothetical protein KatS3mg065_0962 [Chloroflexota bacterium]